ncbi:MAG: acyl-CoA thioesterase [Caldilineaceae bacterium]|nr:acyl-CoA thioesterase [Caldilineaceae bacterium]
MDKPNETRQAYRHFLQIPTRWMDNDVYGHVNNVQYYSFFDTVIADYLVHHGGLDFRTDPVVGFAIESLCQYQRAIAYPALVEAGLRVARIGNSSVRYEIGIFTVGHEAPAATGYFVHVFVDRRNENRPTPVPEKIRTALAKLVIPK